MAKSMVSVVVVENAGGGGRHCYMVLRGEEGQHGGQERRMVQG
jgi:hypothetical protein